MSKLKHDNLNHTMKGIIFGQTMEKRNQIELNWQCTLHKAQGITGNTNKDVGSTDSTIGF